MQQIVGKKWKIGGKIKFMICLSYWLRGSEHYLTQLLAVSLSMLIAS